MHSSQPLVADLAPLPKKSGDSGDKSKSRRLGNDLDVTTLRISASPLTNQVVPPSKSSGDVKRNTSQSPNKGVTTVTSVTTNLQKRWSAPPGTNTPPEWRANLDRPRESNPVRGFSVERWQTRIVDGENFLTSWGERALQFGWAACARRSVRFHGAGPDHQWRRGGRDHRSATRGSSICGDWRRCLFVEIGESTLTASLPPR
jgi:hypothetical protein